MLMTLISLILLKTLMICSSLTHDLAILKQWLDSSRFSLIVLMTQCLFTGIWHKISLLPSEPDICLDGQSVERCQYLQMPRRVGGWNTFLGNSVVKSQMHLLPWGDWNQFVPRGFLSQFTNHWFCFILIIVVLSGEILALVLVKDLSKYKTEQHV